VYVRTNWKPFAGSDGIGSRLGGQKIARAIGSCFNPPGGAPVDILHRTIQPQDLLGDLPLERLLRVIFNRGRKAIEIGGPSSRGAIPHIKSPSGLFSLAMIPYLMD
jgi:hypothetical protein